eukprot:scaffold105344_cov21-Tisochrysis_lutea.AAC.1
MESPRGANQGLADIMAGGLTRFTALQNLTICKCKEVDGVGAGYQAQILANRGSCDSSCQDWKTKITLFVLFAMLRPFFVAPSCGLHGVSHRMTSTDWRLHGFAKVAKLPPFTLL